MGEDREEAARLSSPGRSRALLWAPVAVALGFEFYLSSLPSVPMPRLIPHVDKLAHMAYFFGTGALAVRAARFGEGWSRTATLSAVTIAFFLWGVSDEWHQSFTGRSVEALDVAADTLGALLAGLLAERVWVRLRLERPLS